MNPTYAAAVADLQARVNKSLSVFAQGQAGYQFQTKSWEYGALAGLRWRW